MDDDLTLIDEENIDPFKPLEAAIGEMIHGAPADQDSDPQVAPDAAQGGDRDRAAAAAAIEKLRADVTPSNVVGQMLKKQEVLGYADISPIGGRFINLDDPDINRGSDPRGWESFLGRKDSASGEWKPTRPFPGRTEKYSDAAVEAVIKGGQATDKTEAEQYIALREFDESGTFTDDGTHSYI